MLKSLIYLQLKIWFSFLISQSDKRGLRCSYPGTQWGCINLFTIALIWQKRAIPLYWCLLPKLGSSNLQEQTLALEQVLPLFKEYKLIVLGDREFCSVDARILAHSNGCIFLFKAEKQSFY